jgi:ribosomal protein L9
MPMRGSKSGQSGYRKHISDGYNESFLQEKAVEATRQRWLLNPVVYNKISDYFVN